MSLIKWIDFPALGDERGFLVALEAEKSVPFVIKRVYYIFGTKAGVSRGFHAHKKLQQVAICITGSCRMILDDGQQRSEALLNSPNKGLIIGDLVGKKCMTLVKTVFC